MQKISSIMAATCGALFFFTSTAVFAENNYEFYGAIKSSVNSTDDGDESNISVSDNSTRVGLKGSMNVENKFDLIYQFELGLDTTERERFNSGRNTFIGAKGDFGKIMVGQHDTPLKDTRGSGAEIFNDTIAGSRAMISAVADDDGDKLDIRAKNAIMYYSPKFSDMQVFVMYSADKDAESAADNNDEDLFSASLTFKNDQLYVAIAMESQSLETGDDVDNTRIAASYKMGDIQFGGIMEDADAGTGNSLSRKAYAVNGRYNLSDKTWVGLQYGVVDDYDGSSDTGGNNISGGIMHQVAKPTSVYAVFSMTSNDDNAQFGLSQGGIQDRVTAAAPGDDVSGISVGVVHKF